MIMKCTASESCEYDPAHCTFYTIIYYESPTDQYANLNEDCIETQQSLLNLSENTNWNMTDEWFVYYVLYEEEYVLNVNVNITLNWNGLFCDQQLSVITYIESSFVKFI